MTGWWWCVAGLVLMTAEVALPSGFFLLLLGVSGVIVGVISLTGLLTTWASQGIVFSVLAIVLWCLLAGRLKRMLFGKKYASDQTVGQNVRVNGTIGIGEVGAGDLWGSPWRIKNVGNRPLTEGMQAVVVASEGVTLHVQDTAQTE